MQKSRTTFIGSPVRADKSGTGTNIFFGWGARMVLVNGIYSRQPVNATATGRRKKFTPTDWHRAWGMGHGRKRPTKDARCAARMRAEEVPCAQGRSPRVTTPTIRTTCGWLSCAISSASSKNSSFSSSGALSLICLTATGNPPPDCGSSFQPKK